MAARAVRGRHRHGPRHARRALRRDATPAHREPSRRRPARVTVRARRWSWRGISITLTSPAAFRRLRGDAAVPRNIVRRSGTFSARRDAPAGCVENARGGGVLGSRPREVVFTSSGTEAVNAAVTGALARARAASGPGGGHVVTTAVEHSCVRDAVARGTADVAVVGVDRFGRFDARAVIEAVRDDTTLVRSSSEPRGRDGTLRQRCAARRANTAPSSRRRAGTGHITVDFAAPPILLGDRKARGLAKAGGPRPAGPAFRRCWSVRAGAGPRRHREPSCVSGSPRAVVDPREWPPRNALSNRRARWSTCRWHRAFRHGSLPNLLCVGARRRSGADLLALDQRRRCSPGSASCRRPNPPRSDMPWASTPIDPCGYPSVGRRAA